MGIRLLSISVLCLLFAACSNGGGGGSSPSTNSVFDRDMKWLASDSQYSGKATDVQMNGALTKAFGGTEKSDIHQFIKARVKHVYSYNEMLTFNTSVKQDGQVLFNGPLKELIGNEDLQPTEGDIKVQGANIGAGLAMAEAQSGYDLSIRLPTGQQELGSFRVGLVALTRYYSILPTADKKELAIPAEGRISVLIHEGRHSDCPRGLEAEDCGFFHRTCTSGAAEGFAGCDNSIWGPYALGAIYLRGALANYDSNSLEFRILEFMMDDSFSRLTNDQMDALYNTEPLLNSF